MNDNNQWTSKLSFVLATTGAAVGLGNIWKFAYMAGSHGGSAFVLVYLLCVVLIGVPLMAGEMFIGYVGKTDTVSTMEKLVNRYKLKFNWSIVGWLGCITLLLVLSFYSVVASWSLFYIKQSIVGNLQQVDYQAIAQIWHNLLADPQLMLFYHGIFMLLTMLVVAQGVKQGLERATTIMMPSLFGILVLLVGYAASTAGFKQGVEFLFHFDFSKIDASIAISALGHAFFTLAVGAGCILTYGAYLPNHNPQIIKTVLVITCLDVLVAILSGLAIFPLVFSHGLTPDSGPGLMFNTLPIAFAKMGGGYWFGLLFFLLLLFAAWTSTISIAEPLVALLVKRFNYKRYTACVLVGFVAWILGWLTILSFNDLANFKPLFNRGIFDLITDAATNILLPLGGLGFTLFVGYCIPRQVLVAGLNLQNIISFKIWYFTIRYITPVGIVIILIEGVL